MKAESYLSALVSMRIIPANFIALELLGTLFILFKNCAPSPVILVKYTDVLDKCILLSLLPSYGTVHTH